MDGRIFKFGGVRRSQVDAHTVKHTLDGLFGTRVKHLALDLSSIGRPGDKNQLGGRTAILRGEIEINHTISAFIGGFLKVGFEVIVGFFAGAQMIMDNRAVIFDFVDDIAVLALTPNLEFVVFLNDRVINTDAGTLFIVVMRKINEQITNGRVACTYHGGWGLDSTEGKTRSGRSTHYFSSRHDETYNRRNWACEAVKKGTENKNTYICS